MKRLALLAALGLGCAARQPAAMKPAPIPDATLGLSKGSVFEVKAPPPFQENGSAPGEAALLPRAFNGAPPLVPHGIEDFPAITRANNLCVDCHAVKEKVTGQATPIPASHYTDLRNAPGQVGEKVVGARWVCTACHVTQTDARPLVGNRFAPAAAR